MISTLTLGQLRVLVTIADLGSFAAAGRKLHRTQSAISQAVATLEDLQGVMLFDRDGYRPRLTEVGRVLVEQARRVLATATKFEAIAASTRAGIEPELALAIDPFVPTAPLIESIRALNDTFPNLMVAFSTEGLGGSLRRLRGGTAALAICIATARRAERHRRVSADARPTAGCGLERPSARRLATPGGARRLGAPCATRAVRSGRS